MSWELDSDLLEAMQAFGILYNPTKPAASCSTRAESIPPRAAHLKRNAGKVCR